MSYHKTGTKIRWLFFVETLHLVVHVFQYFFIDLLKTPFCKRCWKVFQTMQPCRVVIELKITAYDWSMDERFTIHHLLSKKKLEFQRFRTVRFKPYKYILKRARYIATHVPKKTDVLASANTVRYIPLLTQYMFLKCSRLFLFYSFVSNATTKFLV